MSQKRKVSLKGKQVLLLGLVALVITAGYYRWTVETEKYNTLPVTGDAIPGENGEGEMQMENKSLQELKTERDSNRSAAMAEWKKTAESNEAGLEAKKEAEEKMKKAGEYSEKEKTIETLIQAKGYSDCFVHISDSGVTVRVSGGEMNGSKVAQMKDIIVGETQVPVRDIKISAE